MSGSRSAADCHASFAPPSPAQKRAIPRFSCTAALFGCSPDSWVRRATVPSGQRLNDSPIRASSESCRAKSGSAAARFPASYRRRPSRRSTASRIDPDAEVEESGGAPARTCRRSAAPPTGSLLVAAVIPATAAPTTRATAATIDDHAGARAHE